MIPAGTIVGDKEIARRFRALPDNVRTKLAERIEALARKLQRMIRQEKLNGQVLKKKSGLLGRSIDRRMVTDGNSIAGVVSTNVKYGKAHEYGSNEVVTVAEHLRLVKQAFGRELKHPVWATVKSHSVKQNLPERSFLRSALDDMKPEVLASLESAVADGVKQ